MCIRFWKAWVCTDHFSLACYFGSSTLIQSKSCELAGSMTSAVLRKKYELQESSPIGKETCIYIYIYIYLQMYIIYIHMYIIYI